MLQFSSSSGPGGAERVITKLATSLNRQTYYRTVACLFRPGWLKQQCEANGIATHLVKNRASLDPRLVKDLLRIIKLEKISLIHAHEFDAIIHGTMAACLASLPVVATIHGKNYFWEKRRRRLAYRLVSRYARMVAVSEDLRRFVVHSTGIKEARVSVIYNGVEGLSAYGSKEIDKTKEELGLPPSHRVIGIVGSLYPVKGHKYLLDAVPAILHEYPETVFLLIGKGALEAQLIEQAKRLNIEDHVKFLGLRDDIQKLLALMDLFVLPSLSEGLSMSILEAMMAGKPIVATDVGGNPELIVNGESGFLVPSENSEALATSIVSLLKDAARATRFGENGRRRATLFFGHDRMVEQYCGLYESCLKG
ncbi:MAG TPA: glycosyltransferase [Nitrospiraceae bacterium]|nr:glycosyltransferase [Nitrospiraceae bacterium]